MNNLQLCIITIFAPLVGAIVAGIFHKQVGKSGAHFVTIAGVFISFICSLWIAANFYYNPQVVNTQFYTWASGAGYFPYNFSLGFLIDPLTIMMLVIVSFVSLLVHIYSMGYMAQDPSYQRFFSYISLFTFMMFMLVTANNFLQLFFGWEGVGLVSYLLIGFWYTKESALQGSLKAFLINRVGDFGFILGIGLIFSLVGSLDYNATFSAANKIASQNIELFAGHPWPVINVICILLFVGAMGKSAQVPLHVWLPESMEGPTPISALIHAATMVTAGVFMVARLSPLYELSQFALSFILIIGATGALFTGLLAIVMDDIKKVIAYSTLSQLGYMMVAMGLSVYSAGMFHLLTHACFKALLFLAAGSVIVGMHHKQDMKFMGGLKTKMPITYITFLIGSLALCALPPFSGFYSKDTIIDAASLASVPGSSYAYVCVLLGAMVTALYTFRALLLTFHGKPRMPDFDHIQESPRSIVFPLIMLAIPSVVIGFILYKPMLFGNFFQNSIYVAPQHNLLKLIAEENPGPVAAALHGLTSLTFLFTISGIIIALLGYLVFPALPAKITHYCKTPYKVLCNKYGFDNFYDLVFVRGAKAFGRLFYQISDKRIIDGLVVNGSGQFVKWLSKKSRRVQSGYLYHYVMIMGVSLLLMISWLILG